VDLGSKRSSDIVKIAEAHRVNLRVIDANTLGITLDETVTESDLAVLVRIFNGDRAPSFTIRELAASLIGAGLQHGPDRKSTRLNSSHGYISYAVFCLKKKKIIRLLREKLAKLDITTVFHPH